MSVEESPPRSPRELVVDPTSPLGGEYEPSSRAHDLVVSADEGGEVKTNGIVDQSAKAKNHHHPIRIGPRAGHHPIRIGIGSNSSSGTTKADLETRYGDKLKRTPFIRRDVHVEDSTDGQVKPSSLFQRAVSDEVDEDGESPIHPGHSLLLVEDVNVSRKVARLALHRARYKVDLALDGSAAVEKFKKKHYDVVLMDIQLPQLTGEEATAQIRAFEEETGRGRALIVGLTTKTEREDLLRYARVGLDGCIPKGSVLPPALQRIIEQKQVDPAKFVFCKTAD